MVSGLDWTTDVTLERVHADADASRSYLKPHAQEDQLFLLESCQ